MPFPWPPATATGLGPMPGDDALGSARLVLDAVPALPFAPWLPSAGVGSDFAGRGCALLVELHVDLQPAGWRLVARPGRDEQRARDARRRELDVIEEAAEGYRGPLKVSVPGPWSLAASVDLGRGERALADSGAVRDLATSLAEGVRHHVAEVTRRIPGVSPVVVQLDEPRLPDVLAGAIPTSSGWSRHPRVEDPVAREILSTVIDAAGDAVGVRCGGAAPPLGLAVRAGARWVGVDGPAVDTVAEDELGDALEGAGAGLLLGLVPPGATTAGPRELAEPAVRLWKRLGLPPSSLPDAVVVTPTEGLELLSPFRAAEVLRRCGDVADALAEQSVA